MRRAGLLLALLASFVPGPAWAGLDVPANLAGVATTAQLAAQIAAQIAAVQATIPAPASVAPPAIVDANSGVLGASGFYALASHSHPSKVRKTRAQTAADGSLSWSFAAAFDAGVTPRCYAVAEVAAGVTDVVNVQIVGTPSATGATFLVNRAQRSVAAVLGLTVLSVPATVGVTWVHALCVEP